MFAGGGEIGLRQQTFAPAELQFGVLRIQFCRRLKLLRGGGKFALPFILTTLRNIMVKLRAAGRRQIAVESEANGGQSLRFTATVFSKIFAPEPRPARTMSSRFFWKLR